MRTPTSTVLAQTEFRSREVAFGNGNVKPASGALNVIAQSLSAGNTLMTATFDGSIEIGDAASNVLTSSLAGEVAPGEGFNEFGVSEDPADLIDDVE